MAFRLAAISMLLALSGCSHCGDTQSPPADTGAGYPVDAGTDTSRTTDTGPPDARCLQRDFQRVPDRRCEGADAAERCSEHPDALNYPVESAVAYDLSFEHRSGSFQVNRESGSDVAYGEVFSSFSSWLQRDFVKERVENGALVLSARGEQPLEAGDELALDRLVPATDDDRDFSEWSERNGDELTGNRDREFRFAPGNFEAGTMPQGWLRISEVTEDTIRADRGRLRLGEFPPSLFILPQHIRVYRFRGERPLVASDPFLEEARVGGYVELPPFIERLNAAMSRCDCLGEPDEPIPFETEGPNDPDLTGNMDELSCRPAVKEAASKNCSDDDVELACVHAEFFCNLTATFVKFADVDSDCDGARDSLSIELEMNMTRGTVLGAADGS